MLSLSHNGLNNIYVLFHIDGLVQDCSISIANALEILLSCTKPWIYSTEMNNEIQHLYKFW